MTRTHKKVIIFFKKNGNKMSHLQHVYNKILSLLHEIEPENNFLNEIKKPKLTHKEWLPLSLAAKTLGID